MRIIVAGGREFSDEDLLFKELDLFIKSITSKPTIVTGMARGADKLGLRYGQYHDFNIKRFYANWSEYGKSAGYRRNVEMADYAEALLAFWDGESKGTKHMIDIATDKGLIVKVIKYKKGTNPEPCGQTNEG